jgi:glycosyltransferase involved in cell wall biosynthesis
MQSLALVIPLKNEELSVEKLITSIRDQTLQPAEIILVDGGSTDQTLSRLKELAAGDQHTRIMETGNAMPGTGRNIGAEETACEWIAFTDAGIRLDDHWLENLAEKIQEHPGPDIIYGNFTPCINSFFEKCAAIAYVPPSRPGLIRARFIASCMMKKEVWKKTGGFPAWRAAEDLVFMEKVEQAGFVITTAPEAMVYWQLRSGLIATYRRFDLYSTYNVWAGRQAFWHYGIARQYAVALLAVVLAFFHSLYWLLLLPVWMTARVAKRMIAYRREFGIKILFNPAIFFGVMAILLAIDAATFSGWIKAIVKKNPAVQTTRKERDKMNR